MREILFRICWLWKNRHWKENRHKRRAFEKALTGSRTFGQYTKLSVSEKGWYRWKT